MKAKTYNQEGKEVGTINLPKEIFGLPWNADLVHQVIVSMRSNQRHNTAHAKGRGVVSGGGRKPWKQKGTGRSRHGSSRSPIWSGGGVTHGPTVERVYDKKINKKMKTKALLTILSQKYRDNELVLLDGLKFPAIKTKEAQAMIKHLSKVEGLSKINYKKGRRALIAFPTRDDNALKSFRNLSSVSLIDTQDLDPVSALTYQYLLITNPEKSLALLTSRLK